MTIISSYINKYGVILASDSNLSSRSGNSGFGQKVFPIQHLNAGLSYSGIYKINGVELDNWMSNFIDNDSFISSSIEEFVINLTRALNLEYNSEEQLSIIHVCGYQKDEYLANCQHWHISNANLIEDTGEYSPKGSFEYHLDFDTGREEDLQKLISFEPHPNNNIFFSNGYPPGRISMMAIRSLLEQLFVNITSQEKWKFRPPRNIFESASQVRLYYHILGEMFRLSDYDALFVGGETQIHIIPAPSNLKKQ